MGFLQGLPPSADSEEANFRSVISRKSLISTGWTGVSNGVDFRLTTHDSDGVRYHDAKLAAAINRLI